MKRSIITVLIVSVSITTAIMIFSIVGIALMCVFMPNDGSAPDIATGKYTVDNTYVPSDGAGVGLQDIFGGENVVITISEMTEKQVNAQNALCFLPFTRKVEITVDGENRAIRISDVNPYSHGNFGIEFYNNAFEKVQLRLSCRTSEIRAYFSDSQKAFARFVKDAKT